MNKRPQTTLEALIELREAFINLGRELMKHPYALVIFAVGLILILFFDSIPMRNIHIIP